MFSLPNHLSERAKTGEEGGCGEKKTSRWLTDRKVTERVFLPLHVDRKGTNDQNSWAQASAVQGSEEAERPGRRKAREEASEYSELRRGEDASNNDFIVGQPIRKVLKRHLSV